MQRDVNNGSVLNNFSNLCGLHRHQIHTDIVHNEFQTSSNLYVEKLNICNSVLIFLTKKKLALYSYNVLNCFETSICAFVPCRPVNFNLNTLVSKIGRCFQPVVKVTKRYKILNTERI